VRAAEAEAASAYSHATIDETTVNLSKLRIDEFVTLVRELFLAMGYSEIQIPDSRRIDLMLRDDNALVPPTILVEIKRYTRPMHTNVVFEVIGLAHEVRADAAIIVTSGCVTGAAAALAARNSVRLIDGNELRQLLREHLGLHAVFGQHLPTSEKDN
jgi:restriction system protein